MHAADSGNIADKLGPLPIRDFHDFGFGDPSVQIPFKMNVQGAVRFCGFDAKVYFLGSGFEIGSFPHHFLHWSRCAAAVALVFFKKIF